ncbi:MAG TPA: hypothetical protein DIS94_10665, partial [Bacteroidetes bacterium]|nr:hypothetical protein [Bacteroidota bacterium]
GSKIELTSPGSYNIKILTEDSLVTYFDLDTTFENNYNIIYLFINRDIVIQNADTLNPYYKINIPISKFYFIDITKRIKFLTL